MKSRYVDPYVICPYYAYEESNTFRKIHCTGYTKGIAIHLYFSDKTLKKLHKKRFCKNISAYQQCPLYQGNSKYIREDDNG